MCGLLSIDCNKRGVAYLLFLDFGIHLIKISVVLVGVILKQLHDGSFLMFLYLGILNSLSSLLITARNMYYVLGMRAHSSIISKPLL